MTHFPARHATADDEPPRLTLRIRCGDEWRRWFLFRQIVGDTGERIPIDVSSHSFRAWVSIQANDDTLEEMAVDMSRAVDGVVSLSLTEEQTGGLLPAVYRWRMIGQAPGDVEKTAICGQLEITRR
jgi:hypothetical protein